MHNNNGIFTRFILIKKEIIDVEGSRIGNNNIVEARGTILGSTAVGNYCVIGSGCSTENNETIADLTVIYGSQSKRRTQNEPLAVSDKLCKFCYTLKLTAYLDSSNVTC